MMHRGLLALFFILVLSVVACQPDPGDDASDERASALPNFARQTNIAETEVAATVTAAASITPTATEVFVTPTIDPDILITFTPEPTVITLDLDDPLGNTYPQQAWQRASYFELDGTEQQLVNFDNQVVVVQVIDTDCNEDCMVRLASLRELAADYAANEQTDVAFVLLNVNDSISARSLEAWAGRNNVSPDESLQWYLGTASGILRQEMMDTFGEASISVEFLPLIVIDQDGLSHISLGQIYSTSQLRRVLISYISIDDEPEETEVPEDFEPTPSPTSTRDPQAGTPMAE